MSNDGVHISHCCNRHGCKYSEDDCPVALGKVEAEYKQECCRYNLEYDMPEMLLRMEEISHREPRSLLALGLKTAEETGELAEEILIECGESLHKSPGKDGVPGEAVDVMLMAVSVFFKAGHSMEELVEWANKKMDKWEEKMDYKAERTDSD